MAVCGGGVKSKRVSGGPRPSYIAIGGSAARHRPRGGSIPPTLYIPIYSKTHFSHFRIIPNARLPNQSLYQRNDFQKFT